MINNIRKAMIILPVIVILWIFGSPSVMAATITSDCREYTYNGITYAYMSSINNDASSYVKADTAISCNAHVPAGQIGAQARIYSTSGVMLAESAVMWNTSTSNIQGAWVKYSGNSNYYSMGKVYIGKNKKTTYVFETARTGFISGYSLGSPVEVMNYPVNQNGETYGSSLYASNIGEEPDLVLAIGINGKTGYVRNSDTEVTSVDNENITIPLYESDGKTVIGSFILTSVQ